MANSYTWIIEQLQCYTQQDSLNDVVINICWRRQATDNNGHYSSIYGNQTVALDPEAPFTPFAELTFEQVCGWLEAAIGEEQIAKYDLALAAEIDAQANPPIVAPPLPWAAPSVAEPPAPDMSAPSN